MKRILLAFLLAPCAAAFAAGVVPGTAPPAAAASGSERTQVFTQQDYVPGNFTLQKLHGSVGRADPIGDDFPVQLRFAGDTTSLDCRLHLTRAGATIAPGETAVVSVRCKTPHSVSNHAFDFVAFENGRRIGQGTLRP